MKVTVKEEKTAISVQGRELNYNSSLRQRAVWTCWPYRQAWCWNSTWAGFWRMGKSLSVGHQHAEPYSFVCPEGSRPRFTKKQRKHSFLELQFYLTESNLKYKIKYSYIKKWYSKCVYILNTNWILQRNTPGRWLWDVETAQGWAFPSLCPFHSLGWEVPGGRKNRFNISDENIADTN